ncbi:methyltransferase [Aureitalea sp. L0-47]|uniref:methyltransferase n=1 Tax=Aureitalea sp. L0-47 TaxID=2816962 RepID=UPI002237744E|nr:methyltransferase [Aureitalea sp. L0-47]MCW5520211.1 methyltransferase [Aureitalea sp. L0-47]
MERIRKPFEGVWNIVRFNWHFYVIFVILVPVIFFLLNHYLSSFVAIIAVVILVVPVLKSLIVSYWVYDRSDLYTLNYLEDLKFGDSDTIVNINAGFDETSEFIRSRYPGSTLKVFDFYNPERHTEVSIKRARKAYPPYHGSTAIETSSIPVEDETASGVFVFMSAHEIRDQKERIQFFKDVNRILTSEGRVVVVEHLRDLPNFLAYTVGVFHFFSKKNWLKSFSTSDLYLQKEIKITPFVSTFILTKNGATS